MSRPRRRQANVPSLHVFPPIEYTASAGLVIGAAVTSTLAWISGSGLVELAACGVLGALGGVVASIVSHAQWAATTQTLGLTPPPRQAADPGPLWDRWLDAEAVVAAVAHVVIPDAQAGPHLLPHRARVRPRVISPETGESMNLADEILSFAEKGERGAIRITGSLGSGKTVALEHLAAVLPPALGVRLLDDPDGAILAYHAAHGLVVYATKTAIDEEPRATFHLAPWSDDERIEYLLAAARDQCASVTARLRTAADRESIGGNPELWRIVLDRMAGDPAIMCVKDALRQELDPSLASNGVRRMAEDYCMALSLRGQDAPLPLWPPEELSSRGPDRVLLRLIRHRPIQLLIAADRIVAGLARSAACTYLATSLPRDLVLEAGPLLRENAAALEELRCRLGLRRRSDHPMAASLIHAAATGWRPDGDPPPRLSGAYLERAAWRGVDLRSAELVGTDLAHAELWWARLDQAQLDGARLSDAFLRGASLVGASAKGAELTRANLESVLGEGVDLQDANLVGANLTGALVPRARLIGANLTAARLIGADLTLADLRQAEIEGADFTRAILDSAVLKGLKLSESDFTDARFQGADLTGCDLEGMTLPGANFRDARLVSAHMTGSNMPGADFRGACLRTARLAEVQWEGACLANADLRTASFHLGSSRSGLVDSPIACEGSRTGFYTDEYDEQDFKPPEEIRKANLCGADLRGALIDDVDFYLVDLRGAVFDGHQAEHFRRCGAIFGKA